MGLLQVATKQRAAAKIGIFGPGGSGKSLTATLIAIALSKTYHKGAPVALHDTEGASDWLLDIFTAEGVELRRHVSKSFKDMRAIEHEARAGGCCVFISDSYSHPWTELQDSLKTKLKVARLEFHHMQELQGLWQEWVVQMTSSPLHCIMAGRLAYEWENERDEETGKMGFQKAGTKMRAEKDAGYEPDLLIEMEAYRVMERELKRGRRTLKQQLKAGGHFLHRLHVLKDRSRALNGKMFEFKDINDYKPGDWRPTLEALRPHLAKLTIGGEHKTFDEVERSSASLFDGRGDSAYQQRARRVAIVLEELQATLVKLWQGQDAKSKALKALAIEVLFGTRSWTAVESKSLEALDEALDALTAFEEKVEDGASDAITDANACTLLLRACMDTIASTKQQAEDTVGIL